MIHDTRHRVLGMSVMAVSCQSLQVTMRHNPHSISCITCWHRVSPAAHPINHDIHRCSVILMGTAPTHVVFTTCSMRNASDTNKQAGCTDHSPYCAIHPGAHCRLPLAHCILYIESTLHTQHTAMYDKWRML